MTSSPLTLFCWPPKAAANGSCPPENEVSLAFNASLSGNAERKGKREKKKINK